MARVTEKGNGWFTVAGTVRTVTVTRYFKSEGATFSGWVARCDDGANYSDPVNKAEALRSAKAMADGEYAY